MSGRYRRFLARGGGAFTMISNRIYSDHFTITDAVQSTQLQNKNTIMRAHRVMTDSPENSDVP